MTDEEYADWQRDTHNAARQRIIDAYEEHLGREPENDDVIEAYIANPGGLDDSVSAIAHSDEAIAKGEADFQAGFDLETGHSLPIPQVTTPTVTPTTATPTPPKTPSGFSFGEASATDAAVNDMIQAEKGHWRRTLAARWPEGLVDEGGRDAEIDNALAGMINQFQYARNFQADPMDFIDDAIATAKRRQASGGDRAAGGYNTNLSDDPTIRAQQQAQWGTEGQNMPAYARGTDRVDLPPPPPPPPAAANTLNNLIGGGNQGAPAGWPSGGAPAGAQPWGGFQSAVGPWGGGGPPVSPYMSTSAWSPYQPATPYIPAVPYSPGTYQPPTYTPAAPFTGPTAAQLTADPGYQFRLQQGQEALERSGAARGVTNTGGTLKDILDYGQQAASQEYGNVYNRMAGTYGMNEAARQAAFGLNAPQQFQGWAATEAGRLGAYQMAEADRAGAYGMNEANRAAAAQFNQTGYQQAWQNEAQRQQQDYANRYRQWSDQYNQWRQQGADRFNEQWMLANA